MVRVDIDGIKCDYLSQGTWKFGDLEFSSEICSGNIAAVEQLDDACTSFELTTAPDCAGMACVTGYRTWFYYVVRGAKKDLNLSMTVSNLNPQTKMFNQGMKPCYRIGDGPAAKWERVASEIMHSCGENRVFQIKFKFRFSSDTPVYFAFSYPYSFEETVRKCDEYEKMFSPTYGYARSRNDSIYFERELLTRSMEGRRVEILTISDMYGCSDETEEAVLGLYPGESPAQWMWEGFMDLILSTDDPRGKALRRLFVFKVVPMINPDGVARGHYRADTNGLNLNRFYDQPCPKKHPTIWAIKEAILALHKTLNLRYFVDLHAHATKRGAFCYANALSTYQEQVENMTYSRLISLNCPHYDFNACVFSEKAMESKDKNGQSKEGSSRVGIYRATNLVHCITVEANYNSGRVVNTKAAAATSDGRASPAQNWKGPVPKYDTSIFRQVGKAVGVSTLDMTPSDEFAWGTANPWSRLPNSSMHKTLPEIQAWVKSRLLSVEPYRAQLLADKKAADANGDKKAAEVAGGSAAVKDSALGAQQSRHNGDKKAAGGSAAVKDSALGAQQKPEGAAAGGSLTRVASSGGRGGGGVTLWGAGVTAAAGCPQTKKKTRTRKKKKKKRWRR